ncbi:MAG: M28 family peptidase, partial [Bacteroidota bacterium]
SYILVPSFNNTLFRFDQRFQTNRKNMNRFPFLLLAISLLFVLQSCKDEAKTSTVSTPTPVIEKIRIPRFDRDSAYTYVAKQVAFGPRVPNTAAHTTTKNWLSAQLKRHGATVIEQDFQAKAYTGTVLNGTNIIGQFNPNASKRILLAAHWDSRHITDADPDPTKQNLPVDAADDGASGVGILLEIARQLNTLPDYMGVDIIFFDAEDHGISGGSSPQDAYTWCLGSQHWSRNLHVAGYKAKYGILLDMVGAKNPRFRKEGYSMAYAPDVVNKVWKLAKEMSYGNYFTDEKGGGITDDHRMVNEIARIPMIDIINMPNDGDPVFVDHWHTTNDNMSNINKRTLGAVGQIVLAVIYNEAMGKF